MKHFYKIACLLFVILTLFMLCNAVLAQVEEEREENILSDFPKPKYTYRFFQNTKREFYRFPYKVPLFDPLDLKYFPHESWWESDWALLSQYEDSYTYKQLVMLRDPVDFLVFNGTAIGQEYGFLDDFYLYITMFVSDSYPDNAGSCYVYYSDSLFKGFGSSTGIMIDPEVGILRFDNYYNNPYWLTNKSNDMSVIAYLNGEDYPIDEENIASSSYGAKDFIYDLMDDQFVQDWNSVKDEFHLPGSTVRAYRVELIREGTNLRIYINGQLAAKIDDEIYDMDEDSNYIPGKVSWSYGPLLRGGGQTVTCSVGAIYLNGRATQGGMNAE